ncbi:MAG: alpha/beta fold hydrolase [Ktedonobacteraceae bacterium]|nr:alpha/beta fold hydrolase [Ktedonobacteraceae bacterium]
MTHTPDYTDKAATEFIEINGMRLAYSQTGSGPLAIYAHGLTLSRASDRRLGLLDFSPIAADHHLIAYDARGHGESGVSRNPEDYTWPSLADDLLALADRFSADQPISAIGTSMGTGTILHAVVKAPNRFGRLVLTAPPTAWEARANQAEVYERMAAILETSSSEAAAAVFSQIPAPSIFADVSGYLSEPDVQPAVLPTVLRGAGRSNLPSREQLARITQPTLILSWATDPTHPVAVAEELARMIPGARLHVSTTAADVRTWGERAAAFLAGKP